MAYHKNNTKPPVLIEKSLDLFDSRPVVDSFIDTRTVIIRPTDGWQQGNTIGTIDRDLCIQTNAIL